MNPSSKWYHSTSPCMLFFLHFCDVGDLADALASPVIILMNEKNLQKINSSTSLEKIKRLEKQKER